MSDQSQLTLNRGSQDWILKRVSSGQQNKYRKYFVVLNITLGKDFIKKLKRWHLVFLNWLDFEEQIHNYNHTLYWTLLPCIVYCSALHCIALYCAPL